MTGRETDAPIPKKSGRRRGGETRRGQFVRTATSIARPAEAGASAVLWLADTLDWLNLWQPGGTELTDDRSQTAPNNDLSPRL